MTMTMKQVVANFTIILTLVLPFGVECARILALMPVASYAHQVPFQPLWKELSLRGHQVTVMTTNPMKDPSLTNLTEIDISYCYEIYKKYNASEHASDDSKTFLELVRLLTAMSGEATDYQLSLPEVKDLIYNKEVKFDLVIVEAQFPTMMVFSWRFNCPMIGIASLDSGMQYHAAMGNPIHPIAYPDLNLLVEDPENLTFKDRLTSLGYYIIYSYVFYSKSYPALREKLKTMFGDEVPDFLTLHDNMVMLLINTHPIFHSIRPLGPNTIPVGSGIHLNESRPLPKDIQKYLDNAKEGVIYFSLGTNIRTEMLRNMMPGILQAFSEVPYKVLMKIDIELENIPNNVAVHKWLPQKDLLGHPNVKLFITQGGLQSLQEAVYNAVPLIAIPFFGDQIGNSNRIVKKGYGLKLHKWNVTRESLKESIQEVMNNPKYREKVKELSEIYRDEEVPSLKRAIYWTEYVIKHKWCRHLRNPAVDLPLWKYCMLDLVGFVLVILSLMMYIFSKIVKYIVRLIIIRPNTATKQKVQ